MARTYRPLDGVLLFDKPLELSSNIALQKVRRMFQAYRHARSPRHRPAADLFRRGNQIFDGAARCR
jgi:hypothetical protein